MLNNYVLRMPRVVYSGENSLENIERIISDKYKKIAIFTDKGIIKAGVADLALNILKNMDVEIIILNNLPTEPSCDEAQQIIGDFKNLNCDFIIAIGGGSVMDIAKLASVAATDDYTVRDLLDNPQLAKKKIKTLMIPTTAGTGSEATPNSIVGVPEKELKVGIVNDEMIADYVILDGNMIKNLPKKIAAATGVDALAHAVECFTSKKANLFSDTFALEALKMIFNNIEKACSDKDALKEKNKILIASFYAGVAIGASGTTAVHALSYPLGGKYHIPHGVSNAMLLIPVMKFNKKVCKERFALIYDAVNLNGKDISIDEKATWVLNRMDEIVTNLEVEKKASAYGVSMNDLEDLVGSGMQVERLLVNNMKEITADDARNLYLEILK